MNELQKHCLGCGKLLRGRADKKFCDDYCRNNYNNQHYSEQNNTVKKINSILKKNRKILVDLLHDKEEFAKVKKEKLSEMGFVFNYYTHHYQTQNGKIYTFCYEYGYLTLDADWVLVVKSKEK